MKKFLKVISIEAEPMSLGAGLKNGLVELPEGVDEYDENEEGFRTIQATIDGKHIESWAPEDVFRANWPIEVKDDLIGWVVTETVTNEYKDLFRAEYQQLQIRYNRLSGTIHRMSVGVGNLLEHEPKCKVELLQRQLEAMRGLLLVMIDRAVEEEIYIEIEGAIVEHVENESINFIDNLVDGQAEG